jgi:hypothetical protein
VEEAAEALGIGRAFAGRIGRRILVPKVGLERASDEYRNAASISEQPHGGHLPDATAFDRCEHCGRGILSSPLSDYAAGIGPSGRVVYWHGPCLFNAHRDFVATSEKGREFQRKYGRD